MYDNREKQNSTAQLQTEENQNNNNNVNIQQIELGKNKLQQQDIQQIQEKQSKLKFQQKHSFHMFVNSKSGGCSGKKFLQIPNLYMDFEIQDPVKMKEINKKYAKNKQKQGEGEQQKQQEQEIKDITYKIEIYFHDLCDPEKRREGLEKVTKIEKDNIGDIQVYCIVAGGDGSVLWVVDEMAKANCNFEGIPIGIIAIGTGNDYSRQMGWGPEEAIAKILEKNQAGLKKLALKWVDSRVSNFDLWDFDFEVFDGGNFTLVKNNEKGEPQKTQMKDQNNQIMKSFQRTMSNYFSIGIDARIGFGFDKKRTESRQQNKCIYCWEGVKKFFLKTKRINNTLENLVQVQDNSDQPLQQQESQQNINNNNEQQQQLNKNNLNSNSNSIKDAESTAPYQQSKIHSGVVFSTKTDLYQSNASSQKTQQNLTQKQDKDSQSQSQKQLEQHQQNQTQHPLLLGKPCSLVILNINSYAAGTHGIWKNAEGSSGVKSQQLIQKDKKYMVQPNMPTFVQQSFADKQLEMVSFNSLLSLSTERFKGGQSKRVAQGKGPFVFNYKKHDKNGKLFQTYFQIDGEYFSVLGAKQITVSHTKKVKGGQIKVLVESKQYEKIQNGKNIG